MEESSSVRGMEPLSASKMQKKQRLICEAFLRRANARTRVAPFDGVTIWGGKRGKHEMAARCNRTKFLAHCFKSARISPSPKKYKNITICIAK